MLVRLHRREMKGNVPNLIHDISTNIIVAPGSGAANLLTFFTPMPSNPTERQVRLFHVTLKGKKGEIATRSWKGRLD